MAKTKRRGEFQYILGMDCETTGLCFRTPTPTHNPKTGERHQTVSWGFVVIDAKTLKSVDELYLEIKWNEHSIEQRSKNPNFGKKAEKIHGLTYDKLEQNGINEDDAVVAISALILKYWGPENPIACLGHNVHLFDVAFLRDLFERYNIDLKVGNRHYDTNSIGYFTVGAYNSDELFELVGLGKRGAHNALDDAKMAFEAARRIKMIFQRCLEQ